MTLAVDWNIKKQTKPNPTEIICRIGHSYGPQVFIKELLFTMLLHNIHIENILFLFYSS